MNNINNQNTKKIHTDIRFWILIFFLIRLIGITNAPLEIGHNWRQVTGLMVARNFTETDSNIFKPRIDDNYGATGIIGMEFPVLNYLHFLMAKIFGYSHWYGRLINLIISSIGIFYFYKIIRKYFNEPTAFYATLSLLSSIWFAFSRKMMPDTFCISLIFIGIYYGLEYLQNGKLKHILLYVFFVSIAILSKIPAGIYLIVLAVPIFSKIIKQKQKIILIITTLIPLILSYLWYFIWNPYLSVKYGRWYNNGVDLATGISQITGDLRHTLERFYFSSFHSYLFFILFLVGLFLIFKNKNKKIIYVFSIVTTIFLLYIFKSGHFFCLQNYYIIPYVPIMALLVGYTSSQFKRKWVIAVILLLGIGEGIANQQQDFFIKDSQKYKLELENIADSCINKSDLIIINGGSNPQLIYFANRKGWTIENLNLNSETINRLKFEGADYLIIDKKSNSKSFDEYTPVFDNKNFKILKLD